MDGEFEKLKDKLVDQIEVNTTAKNEHVGEIERKIRHIKDRCRSMEAAMPFDVLPNIMIKAMVINAVMLLNAHVDKQGIRPYTLPESLYCVGNWITKSIVNLFLDHIAWHTMTTTSPTTKRRGPYQPSTVAQLATGKDPPNLSISRLEKWSRDVNLLKCLCQTRSLQR